MQAMQPGQQPSPFLNTLYKFCNLSAFVIAVLFVPDLFDLTHDFIASKITQHYGGEWVYLSDIGWWIALFGLIYYGLTFALQTSVTFINTLWYARNF
jgi:hypothetical protein